MLNALRKNAGSWVVKVLLLLLVASFAIWGIGDVFFSGGQNPAVATVGGIEIPANELANAFNRSVANLQRQLGPQFDREQAIQLGVMQQALQDPDRAASDQPAGAATWGWSCPTTPCARWSPRTRCSSPTASSIAAASTSCCAPAG